MTLKNQCGHFMRLGQSKGWGGVFKQRKHCNQYCRNKLNRLTRDANARLDFPFGLGHFHVNRTYQMSILKLKLSSHQFIISLVYYYYCLYVTILYSTTHRQQQLVEASSSYTQNYLNTYKQQVTIIEGNHDTLIAMISSNISK